MSTLASFILVEKVFSLIHSVKANCRCTPIADLQDFMRRIEFSPDPAALLSSSESMTQYSSFLVTVLNVNSSILRLSGYLKAISEPLKTPILAIELFRQLTIFLVHLKIYTEESFTISNHFKEK